MLGAEVLGSVHHVGESSLGFGPLSSFQAAVGVNPELLWAEVLKHLRNAVFDLLLAGDTRRVDVVDTGADVARIGLINKDLEQLSIALAVLDGENVSIEGSDGVEEVLELRVAEVRVDLSAITNASGGEAESLHSPLEVVITLLASAKRETLTESGLVDLDDVDASGLQIDNLITESKGKLLSLDGLVDIVTGERPPQASDRASKHALHGLLGDRRCVLGLLDGHRSRAGDITNNDWWAHTARAVALNPGVGGEDITSESLTEVLNHVVTLRLSVDKDIQIKLLLDLDDILNLLLDELLVLLGSDIALGVLVSLDTDLRSLGEGSDGGGWEEGEIEILLLLANADWEWVLAVVHLISDGGLSLLDLLVIGALRRSTGLDGLCVGLELVTDSGRTLSHGLGNHGQFRGLLNSKAEPAGNLGVKLLLASKSMRGVQERAGSSNDDALLAKLLNGELDDFDGLLEVGLPDVTAVNDTGRECLVGTKGLDDGLQLLWVADEVDVDSMEVLEMGKGINVVDDVTEVSGEDETRSLVAETAERLIGGLEGSLDLGSEIEDQDGLINLNGLGSGSLELSQEVNVEREQLGQEGDGVDGLVTVGLAKSKERNGTQDDRAGDDAGLLGLLELNNGLRVGGELELLAITESGLDIVVVGVKPFHHFLIEYVRQGHVY